VDWTYDGIYRLTNETISLDPHTKNGSVDYGLDAVGNRRSETSTLPGISTGAATFDANDRLSTETYDNNGNTTVSGARTFAYDFENRLKSMNGTAVTLQYDGDGNRVAKAVGGVTTRYLVDDLNPTGYAQVVEEIVGGSVTRTYTYGRQRISQNQLINSTWTSGFYGYDGLGSVRQLSDATGTVTDTYDYDAWGNAVNTTGSTPNVYLYRNEQFDGDLGLYYLRARYLNPLTGRFLTTDPASGIVMEPATFQKYLYASANPVDRIDPTGWAASGAVTPEAGGYLHFTIGPLAFFQMPTPKKSWWNDFWNWLLFTPDRRGGTTLPFPNICPTGDTCVLTENGPNPFAPGGQDRFSQWKNQFRSKCEALQRPGKSTVAVCHDGSMSSSGAVAYCMCCESSQAGKKGGTGK
jgi:RHS repeat-associated protein